MVPKLQDVSWALTFAVALPVAFGADRIAAGIRAHDKQRVISLEPGAAAVIRTDSVPGPSSQVRTATMWGRLQPESTAQAPNLESDTLHDHVRYEGDS